MLFRSQHKHRICWYPVSICCFVLILTAINFGELHQHQWSNRTGYIFFWWSHHICGYEHCVFQSRCFLSPFLFLSPTQGRIPAWLETPKYIEYSMHSYRQTHTHKLKGGECVVWPPHWLLAISLQSPPRLPWGFRQQLSAQWCLQLSRV